MRTTISLYYVIVAGFILYFIVSYAYRALTIRNFKEPLKSKSGFLLISLKHGLGIFLLGIIFFLSSFNNNPDSFHGSDLLRFEIYKKDKNLGYIELKRTRRVRTTEFDIKSEINAKFILNFKVRSKETYIYRNDTLIYSYMYRTLNNRVKVDQTIIYKNGEYQLSQKDLIQTLTAGVIRYNLVKLYFEKPDGLTKVFCDKQRKFLEITRMNPDTYRVVFPDKTYNVFHYNGNGCESIEAVGSFYKVRLIPKYSI